MKEGEAKVEQVPRHRRQEHQRLAVGSLVRRPRLLSTATGCMRAAGAKAGIYGNDAVEAMYPMTKTLTRRRAARRQQAQLHAHVPRRTIPAGERLLVGDDVRRQDATADQEPDRPLPDQLADAAGHEEERGRLAHALHPEGRPGEDKEANWLPAPDGPIYLVMRLYWPKTEAPSILPPGEGTWKPPAS